VALAIHGGTSYHSLFDVMKLAVLQQYLKITSCLAILARLRALLLPTFESWLDGYARRQQYQKLQLLAETPSDRAVVMKPPGFAK
jgi:hypothetical protein